MLVQHAHGFGHQAVRVRKPGLRVELRVRREQVVEVDRNRRLDQLARGAGLGQPVAIVEKGIGGDAKRNRLMRFCCELVSAGDSNVTLVVGVISASSRLRRDSLIRPIIALYSLR
jgi:hypothetical protein